ncbi:MAG: hypothetical protein AAGF11_00615 [Myxococcota bacterium]
MSGDEPSPQTNPGTTLASGSEPRPDSGPEPSLNEQRAQLAAVLQTLDARLVAMANDANYAEPELAAALGELRAHIGDAETMMSQANDDEFLDRLEGITDNLKRSFARLKDRL